MPKIEWFATCFPGRRADRPIVEVTLTFGPDETVDVAARLDATRSVLAANGLLEEPADFPPRALPDPEREAFASLLAQTALLFQQRTGHVVDFYDVIESAGKNLCIALVEHEHCDVGMTAVKLAAEVVTGRRRQLREPFRAFSAFARERLLPAETAAIIRAAGRRDIPAIKLERQPFRRADFEQYTGGRCISPNGLLLLGHGVHRKILDGTTLLAGDADLPGRTSLPGEPGQLEAAAEDLVRRLFPTGERVRMPVVAITGTNGKTTTSRLVNSLLRADGRRTGLVTTTGTFLNGEQVASEDLAADTGHLMVLTSTDVDIAVLETHHLGIIHRGFAFEQCDIAVCTNVSEDHLGDGHVDTIGEMAELKRAVPKTAREAVVLNADDPHCLAMREEVNARRCCLVSMERGWAELRALPGRGADLACLLEKREGRDWAVIRDGGGEGDGEIPLLPVHDIPITLQGTARFNVSNALHAAAAAYLAGASAGAIRQGLAEFLPGYDSNPGRMNVFDDLPFRIVLDFAHNLDGLEKLCEFVDLQQPEGRKRVAFAGVRKVDHATLKRLAAVLAGHFDDYCCKDYQPRGVENLADVAPVLREGLIEAGVSPERISIMTYGREVIFGLFDRCRPGDLLVIAVGYAEQHDIPRYISEYVRSRAQP